MRARFLQRPNRSEGPCGKACRIEGLRNHKVPLAYSRADDNPSTRKPRVPGIPQESARSLYGRRDDGHSKSERVASRLNVDLF